MAKNAIELVHTTDPLPANHDLYAQAASDTAQSYYGWATLSAYRIPRNL